MTENRTKKIYLSGVSFRSPKVKLVVERFFLHKLGPNDSSIMTFIDCNQLTKGTRFVTRFIDIQVTEQYRLHNQQGRGEIILSKVCVFFNFLNIYEHTDLRY